MINKQSIEAISTLPNGFMKPCYESYCFSQLPSTLLKLLGCGDGGLPKECTLPGVYKHVIVFLIDGFGWRFLEKYHDKYPFLKRFYDQGIVSKLTSQFPSTTAAHISTLCSGLPVGEHGIYEWFMYEPKVNRIVAPLLYTYAGDKTLGELEHELSPKDFLPEGLFFKELQKHKIGCKVFQQETIADSIYSRWMFTAAERVAYKKWPHALELLSEHLKTPGLYYLYFGEFDAEAHHYGLDSKEVEKSLDLCFTELEKWFQNTTLPASTAIIMTADHGMTEISPETTIYLNERFPNLEEKLKKGANGHVLTPAGSSRDYFLHVEKKHLMDVYKLLKDELSDVAWVCLTAELVMKGFFGNQPISEKFRGRLGDLAIIMKGSHSVWWYEEGRFEQNLHAMHGGLTPHELETIFCFLNL